MRKKSIIVIAIVIALGFIGAVGIPAIKNYREKAAALKCIENMHCIDGGKQQWALEYHQDSNAVPTWDALIPYVGNCFYQDPNFHSNYTGPQCPKGGTYQIGRVVDVPTCTVPGHDVELFGANVCVEAEKGFHVRMAGATVVVIDAGGKRRTAQTDENGCVRIITWPKKAIAFIVSKDGYGTVSNSLHYGVSVVLKKVAK